MLSINVNFIKGVINPDEGVINSGKGVINPVKGVINPGKCVINHGLTKEWDSYICSSQTFLVAVTCGDIAHFNVKNK